MVRTQGSSVGPVSLRPAGALEGRPEVVAGVDVAAVTLGVIPLRDAAGRERGGDDPAAALACAHLAVERFEVPPGIRYGGERVVGDDLIVGVVDEVRLAERP